MERFYCLDCRTTGQLTIRGCCGTCNSQAVTSEHSQNRCTKAEIEKYVIDFPNHEHWVRDAQQILEAQRLRRKMRVV
jgi:hypothetical protein